MPSLNRIQLIGHLGKDPEVRFTPKGKKVCTFSIAVSRRWKSSAGEDKNRPIGSMWKHGVIWVKYASNICTKVDWSSLKVMCEQTATIAKERHATSPKLLPLRCKCLTARLKSYQASTVKSRLTKKNLASIKDHYVKQGSGVCIHDSKSLDLFNDRDGLKLINEIPDDIKAPLPKTCAMHIYPCIRQDFFG